MCVTGGFKKFGTAQIDLASFASQVVTKEDAGTAAAKRKKAKSAEDADADDSDDEDGEDAAKDDGEDEEEEEEDGGETPLNLAVSELTLPLENWCGLFMFSV